MLSAMENVLFAYRGLVLALVAAVTAASVWVALGLRFDTDLERQLPGGHPYARTALDYKDKIAGLNSVQIVVETAKGEIWTPAFLKVLNEGRSPARGNGPRAFCVWRKMIRLAGS